MHKVLVIVPFPMAEEQLALRRAQMQAVRLGPDLRFDFRPVRAAPSNYVSAADMILADVGILEAGLAAQAEGYAAVCIDTMSDSGLAGLRSMLDIPVIAPGRASMLTALMLGERFSILTMWSRWKHLYTKPLGELGIAHKCASIRALDVAPDNRALLSGKEDDIFPLLEEAGRRAIEDDGADVLLLGSTTMHQAHAHLAARLPVPVINPGPLTYKLAELALGLGLTHSRRAYPQPLVPKPELFAAMLAAAAASGK
ncbi:MAG: hydrogenase expression protein HupH [Burkholderiales bacterium]|nr:hydrogenase expression protein HupH [Burkholderiales bacterium]